MWAVVVTLGMLCFMLFGFAWMSTAEKISADVYRAKYLEGRIKALESKTPTLENHSMEHVHRYFDGKIKRIN